MFILRSDKTKYWVGKSFSFTIRLKGYGILGPIVNRCGIFNPPSPPTLLAWGFICEDTTPNLLLSQAIRIQNGGFCSGRGREKIYRNSSFEIYIN